MRKRTQRDHKSAVAVCAWCSRYLGIIRGAEGVSHGICLDCKTRELAHWEARNGFVEVQGTHYSAPLLAGARMSASMGRFFPSRTEPTH